MKLSTHRSQGVVIVRVGETKPMYPMLPDLADSVSTLVTQGDSRVVIDMSTVSYVDSASIGYLMDLYRQATQADSGLKLPGVQTRVETMLTMAGTQHFIEPHADEASAIRGFGE